MNLNDVLDELSHAFLLEKVKRELQHVDDPEQLKALVLSMVDLVEKQKACFKQLLWQLVDEDPEAQKLFE